MKYIAMLLAVCGILHTPVYAQRIDPAAANPLADELHQAFEQRLADLDQYRKVVAAQSQQFPEGDLFPYLLPAFAYTNQAIRQPSMASHARKRVAALIDLSIPVVAKHCKAPDGDLTKLERFNKHGVYLGQLNLALGGYKRIGGDDRYDAIHKHISDLLHEALAGSSGETLESFPDQSWPFDTIPCLLSLRLYDEQTGTPRSSEWIAKHLKWMETEGSDPQLKLPYSHIRSQPKQPPRGCDLSWRIALVAQLDEAVAKRLYASYVEHFWLERHLALGLSLRGFAEWPGGRNEQQDADSGPIIMGIGGSACALGIAATQAMGDSQRHAVLLGQFESVRTMLPTISQPDPRTGQPMIGGQIPYDAAYVSGFLYGDCTLFYATTWVKWTK